LIFTVLLDLNQPDSFQRLFCVCTVWRIKCNTVVLGLLDWQNNGLVHCCCQ
jgi:hypothetical protein